MQLTTRVREGHAAANRVLDHIIESEPAPKEYMLDCRGVGKNFGDVAALSGFSVRLEPGKILALVGPSGCGKTTALRLIAGFASPDNGSIAIAARPVYDRGTNVPPEKRRVGMVFQEGALFPHLTVAQNIAYGLNRKERHSERVAEVVRMTGLDGLTHRMPYELSGGQQQRVALARALAPRPELLLLDEPFSNLDPALREQVRRDVMSILRASGITAVFVTHDQVEAMYVGDTIAVMNRGRIEQEGPPEEIFHRPDTKFVAEFIGTVDFLPARWEAGRIITAVGDAPCPNQPPAGVLESMVRPDCVECYPDEEGHGVVVEREFLGAFYIYRVRLDDGSIVHSLLSHTAGCSVGARVAVEIRCGHAIRPFLNGVALADCPLSSCHP